MEQYYRFCLALLSSFPLWPLFGQPSAPLIQAGEAHLSLNGQTFTIEASDRTILNWESFSIGKEEQAVFVLPTASSAILNRVRGGDLSEIHGTLQCNGCCYLINPNGIWIGPEGKIHASSFIASTLDCSNDEFLQQGSYCFSGSSEAPILIQGCIEIEQGDLALISRSIEQKGEIVVSNGGGAFLGAGQEVVYRPYGDDRIQVVLCSDLGQHEGIGISNEGTIRAASVGLIADGNLYAQAIASEGTIEALEGSALLISENGYISHSGEIYAQEARLLSRFVHVKEEGRIDVSQAVQGGSVLIGGDAQGSPLDPFPNAQAVVVENGARIYADGLLDGNGGKVVLWSEEATGFYGEIFVRGGTNSGDGGFVEVSSKGDFDFAGLANTSAPCGKTGVLLLDPTNITISAAATDAGITFGAGCGVNTYCNTGVLSPRNINNGAIITQLGLSNVIITSTPGGTGPTTGDISFTDPFTWTGTNTNTLTLNARRNITFSSGFTNSTTAGNFICNAGLGVAGTITIDPGVTVSHSSSGNIQLISNTVSGSDVTISGALNVTGGNLTITANDDFTLTAGTGSIGFNSPGNTFTFSTTSATGSVSTFAGPVTITDGAVAWTIAGTGTLAINNVFSTAGTGAISIVSGGALSTGAASTFTHGSSGLCTFQSTGAAATIANTMTQSATGGNLTIGGTSVALNGALSNNSTSGSTLAITATTSTITSNASGTITTASTAGDLTITANTTATFNADVIHNSTTGNFVCNANTSIVFNSNFANNSTSGTTLINASLVNAGAVTIGPGGGGTTFIHSSTGDCSILSSPTATSDMTLNSPLTITNGNLSLTVVDDFTMNATSGISFNALGKTFFFNSTAATGSVATFGAPVTITNGSVDWMTAGTGSLTINNAFSSAGTGMVSIISGAGLTKGATGTLTHNASGSCTLMAGTTATFNADVIHNSTTGNFVCNANTSIAFNSNFANNSTSGTTLINAGLVNAGAVTIGPGGGGTTFIHSSTGDCSILSSPTAGSDITLNNPLTITNGNLSLTVVDDFTMNATSGISFSAPGKTFTFHSTALTGSVATFSAPVTSDSTVDFDVDGGSLTINSTFTTSGTEAATFVSSGATTFGAASTLTHNSTGDLSFTTTGSGSDLTFNGIVSIPNSNATFFPEDDFTLGASGSLTFAGAGKLLDFQSGSSTSTVFSGAVSVTGGTMTATAVDDITISLGGSVTYNVAGGTLTFTATGGADPDFVMNGTLSVPNGTLMISTFDDITFAAGSTFNYGSSDPITLVASGTTGSINWDGSAIVSNGMFTMNAQSNISFGIGSLTTYTSPLPWTLSASTGSIDIDGTISLATAANFTAACGSFFSNQGLLQNTSTGGMSITCGTDFFLGGIVSTAPAQIGSAGGATQVAIGNALMIDSSETTPGATALLGYAFGGQTAPLVVSVGGDVIIRASKDNDAAIFSTGSLTLTSGGNISLATQAISGLIGKAYIQSGNSLAITANNISLFGFSNTSPAFFEAQGGKATVISNVTSTLSQYSYIQNTGSGNLVLVVDEQAPSPPQVGNGALNLGENATLSTNGGELSLFTVSPDQNSILGLINGATLSQGNHLFGVYYSTSAVDPPPFTIFYKGGGVNQGLFARINVAVSEMLAVGLDRALGWDFLDEFWGWPLFVDDSQNRYMIYRKTFEYPLNIID